MIHIDRTCVQCPPELDPTDPQSLGVIETARAIAYRDAYAAARRQAPLTDPHQRVQRMAFAAYKADLVKLALINLFGGKCAYCESDTNATGARDIEHFRPKGRINPGKERPQLTPGYYWLAADWNNLLLACPGCNRSQRQLLCDAEGELLLDSESTGKADLFPLRNERYRVRKHTQGLGREEPHRLLINPCLDELEAHLEYDAEGNIFPKRISGRRSAMARTSIEVYELKRWTLVKARRQRYLEMVQHWGNIASLEDFFGVMILQLSDRVATMMQDNEAAIRLMLGARQPYAGMLRYLWAPLEQELTRIKQAYESRLRQLTSTL